MSCVPLIASTRPCRVTLPVRATLMPPIVSEPPLATMVVSVSAWVLDEVVTWARASDVVVTV